MDSACANVDAVDTSRSRSRGNRSLLALDLRAVLQTVGSRLARRVANAWARPTGAALGHQVDQSTSRMSATSIQSANTVAEVVQGATGFPKSPGNRYGEALRARVCACVEMQRGTGVGCVVEG
jgi:hypothetical protein